MTGGGWRRGASGMVEDRALKALRLAWGDAYDIGHEHCRWIATSRADQRIVDDDTRDDLNRAIRADWAREAAR